MHRVLALLLPLLLLAPSAQAHPPGDPFPIGSPAYVNFLLDRFQTPDLAPGESGDLRFTFTNTYPWRMESIRLRLQIYRYLETDVDLPVNDSWPHARPAFRDDAGIERGRAYEPLVPPLSPGEAVNVSVTVLTDAKMPYGSLTKQGSYFVRTWLEFNLTEGATSNRSVMMSKGYFTDEQFNTARIPCGQPCPSWIYYEGLLNLTYMGSVHELDHLDGLLPDTGFSVKERLPVWPFVAVGAIMVASLAFALLFYAEENLGKYPRLARWWMSVKGRARGARPARRRKPF